METLEKEQKKQETRRRKGNPFVGSMSENFSNDSKAFEIGKRLFAHAKKHENAFDPASPKWWNKQLLSLSMRDSKLKDQLFRFVDVLPSLDDPRVVNKYFAQYISNWNRGLGSFLGETNKFAPLNFLVDGSIKLGVKLMAKTFIVGSTVSEAISETEKLKSKGLSYTLDILGELVVSEEEAQAHLDEYLDLIRNIPNCNVSIKLSSLYSQINPLAFEKTKDVLKEKLRIVYREAIKHNAFVNVDLEHYDWKDLFNEVVKEVLLEDEFRTWKGAGIVLQGYLKESKQDLLGFIDWAKERGTPIMMRLVKGAYWDYETTIAEQRDWESPVFEIKAETDVNYEELTKILFENHSYIKPAIASHNIRSISVALEMAKKLSLTRDEFEIQMLYGMLDSLKSYLVEQGINVRVYLPYGELIPGMAYLVRRLLENTANESFLAQGFAVGVSAEKLLEDPRKTLMEAQEEIDLNEGEKMTKLVERKAVPERENLSKFKNEPNLDFVQKKNRESMLAAIRKFEAEVGEGKLCPVVLAGQEIDKPATYDSLNPSNVNQVIGRISMADEADANQAIEIAQDAYAFWSEVPPPLRAKVLRDTAKKVRESRFRFNAILCLEAGKPWQEADGEVSEIVDFLEYYAAQALDLFNSETLISFSGEKNLTHYVPLGVSAVISPWNFPLAIMGGMSVASLVAGNTVIIKPSLQASVVAYEFFKLLIKSLKENITSSNLKRFAATKDLISTLQANPQVVSGIVSFLPGRGREIGEVLVQDPRTKMLAFTGSSAVGMRINELCNANHNVVKKVVAEMGGKNTVIVDTTADLDEAVPGIVYSAFGFAGQKCSACSRVLVLENVYDSFVNRLVEATKSIVVSQSKEPDCFTGPVIDGLAFDKVREYIGIGQSEATMLCGPAENDLAQVNPLTRSVKLSELSHPNGNFRGEDNEGHFISPTVFVDVDPEARISQEEIFGPVLAVVKVKNIDEAIKIANNTDYGLTGGLYTRSPENIEKVSQGIQVGNFYINRPCTGAIVARQSFGGLKLSSIGFKAGGPNYLLNFVQERTITENTMRRGFVAEE